MPTLPLSLVPTFLVDAIRIVARVMTSRAPLTFGWSKKRRQPLVTNHITKREIHKTHTLHIIDNNEERVTCERLLEIGHKALGVRRLVRIKGLPQRTVTNVGRQGYARHIRRGVRPILQSEMRSRASMRTYHPPKTPTRIPRVTQYQRVLPEGAKLASETGGGAVPCPSEWNPGIGTETRGSL